MGHVKGRQRDRHMNRRRRRRRRGRSEDDGIGTREGLIRLYFVGDGTCRSLPSSPFTVIVNIIQLVHDRQRIAAQAIDQS
jgi:hypothetical protein